MKFFGIIPARYASMRFPGKPLALINGKPMIQRVYEQASKAGVLSEIYVATDDQRIADTINELGGKVFMTSSSHQSGTERCNEVAEKLLKTGKINTRDIIINIQCDEPFLHPEQISTVISCFDNKDVQISTLVKKIQTTDELLNKNVVKVILNKYKQAIYFSRQPIPMIRGKPEDQWISQYDYYKHIGIYAYRTNVLQEITRLDVSLLEKAESLEQLRWIEHGYRIHANITQFDSQAVDTPADLSKFITET